LVAAPELGGIDHTDARLDPHPFHAVDQRRGVRLQCLTAEQDLQLHLLTGCGIDKALVLNLPTRIGQQADGGTAVLPADGRIGILRQGGLFGENRIVDAAAEAFQHFQLLTLG